MAFTIEYNNKKVSLDKPTRILDIVGNSKEFIGAKVDNYLRELTYVCTKDCKIVALTSKDRDAQGIYEASLRYLIAMAMKRIHPNVKIKFTYAVSRSILMTITSGGIRSNQSLINELEEEMKRIIACDYPLIRKKVKKEILKEIFIKEDYLDKNLILKYRPEETAHYYECDGYCNYMYQRMVPSTGYLSRFKLRYYHPGILISYPRSDCNGEIPPFMDIGTFGKDLSGALAWGKKTDFDTIVGINKRIAIDGAVDVITLSEQRHNRQLCELGNLIEKDKDTIKLICIAGPSSSGKTTFANRLRIELLSRGIEPIRISLDDYYLPRDQCPKDEDGKVDLEAITALDVDLFNKNMSDLLAGESVTLPSFDFKTVTRKKGRTLKIGENQPIIIEGIHALNEQMTSSIPKHQKFKIFIAPTAQINMDDHNPMSLTDLRLLRRIVRDYQFRHSSAIETMGMWDSVRKGEFKWIYHTQEGADYNFNSFLPIELSVMKKYAMPLLSEIPLESEFFPVAERLIRMLKFFNELDDKWVPCNSILREFIGGSCYADV